MRNRHKTPTLVSMWMLDVFCCALGCVILLWILQSLATSIQADRVKDALGDLDKTREQLKSTDEKLVAANNAVKETQDRLATATADLANTRERLSTAAAALDVATARLNATTQALTAARRELGSTTKELADAQKKAEDDARAAALATRELEDSLAKKQKAADALKLELATAEKEQSDLAMLKRTLEEKVAAAEAARRATDKQLSDLDAKYQAAAKDAKDADSARADSKDLKDQLARARTQVIDLQGEKKVVDDKFARLKADTDSRFAGIAMTGRNVVFVVDISGSMKLRDERTADPNKWPGVVDTVGRVMRSLPDLEKFQVVIFSKEAKYLFGRDGEWQAFDGGKSVKTVTDALTDTVPGGDTNLYSALDLAFRLRTGGLDTVYLFSDGLPTSGASGLTPEQEKKLTDDQMTGTLSRHLRATLKETWNPRAEGKPRVRINTLGFFYESPEVGAFLWALARENDGSFVGMSKP